MNKDPNGEELLCLSGPIAIESLGRSSGAFILGDQA